MAIIIGGPDNPNAYTYNPEDPSDTSTPAPNQSGSGSTSSNTASDDKKGSKAKGILASIGFAGQNVDENVDKSSDKYNIPGEHKLSSQFRYLADKYYGGDQEAFAGTSQGQVLLNYLQGVPFTKGGGLGLMDKDLQEKVANLDTGFPFDPDSDEFMALDASADPFKTKNLPVNYIRENLTSPEYMKFNQFLYSMRPDLYSQARPVSSGALIPNLIKSGIFNPVGMVGRAGINAALKLAGKDPLKKSKPFQGIIDGPEGTFQYALRNEFDPKTGELFLPGYNQYRTKASQADQIFQPISAELFENLETLDQGGMNDVAQAVVNQNQTPEIDMAMIQEYLDNLPEGGVVDAFDPDSFLAGFGMA